MSAEIIRQLAEFTVNTKYKEVPENVAEFAKGLILKTIAGMVAGSGKSSGREMAELIREHGSRQEVRIIGSGFKTSLWEAVLLNAFFAHASELEDDRFNGGVSWDITVIPVLTSLSDKSRISGEAFMEAVIVGLEVTARTCLFVNPPMEVGHVPGAVGPAAGAARALGLGVRETMSAMGLALPGVPQIYATLGTDAHYLESALMSAHGMIAADMAKRGMTGASDIGRFLSRFWGKERVVPEKMIEDLGQRWLFTDTWVKKYPCCFGTHRQIDAFIELKKEHNLSYEDIEGIELHGGLGDKVLDRPEPKSEQDVQFSLQHVLAVAMINGDVNFEHVTSDAIKDPRIAALRSRVKIIYHPDWKRGALAAPALVKVKTKDGREFSRERMYTIGSYKEPLTIQQIRDLYFKFLRHMLPEENIRKSADTILNLEKLSDMAKLIDIVTVP